MTTHKTITSVTYKSKQRENMHTLVEQQENTKYFQIEIQQGLNIGSQTVRKGRVLQISIA